MKAPESAREECERIQACLEFEDCPSYFEKRKGYHIVWWVYEDTWFGDPQNPDFKFSLAVPEYYTWGKKKREKHIKELRERDRIPRDARLPRDLSVNEIPMP